MSTLLSLRKQIFSAKKQQAKKMLSNMSKGPLPMPLDVQLEYVNSLHRFWKEVVGSSRGANNLIGDGAHKEWCDTFQKITPDNPTPLIFLEPRFSLKTSFLVAFALRWAILYPNSNVFYIRKSFDKAVEWLRELKKIMEENEMFIKIFGDHKFWYGDPNSRNRMNFNRIKNRPLGIRNVISKDPLFQVFGMESAITGTHCERGLVIWDDGADENDVFSKAEYEFTMRFFETLPPIIQDSSFIVTGTRWGKEIYDHILNNVNKNLEEEELTPYVIVQGTPLVASYEKEEGEIQDIYDLPDEEELYRFKTVTKQILKKMRINMGLRKWLANFFQRVIPDEANVFSTEPIYYSTENIDTKDFKKIIAAVDPASGKELGDYTATIVVGLHKKDDRFYILEAHASREAMSKQPRRLANIIRKYYPILSSIIIESNTLDVSLARITIPNLILEEIKKMDTTTMDGDIIKWSKQRLDSLIKYKRAKKSKESRIASLEPPVTFGFLLFPDRKEVKRDEGFKELFSELDGYTARGAEDKDDLLDALQIAYEYISYNFGKKSIEKLMNRQDGE